LKQENIMEERPDRFPTPRWIRPFQRVTSGGNQVREIDGLRFVALAMVVLLHLNHYVVLDATVTLRPFPPETVLNRFLEQGDFGVQLFFAISGFILAIPFARHRLCGGPRVLMKSYFLRRITRLEPPLILNLAILLVLMVFALKRPLAELSPHFLASCVYLHTAIFGENSSINPVIWSLEVEAQFYLSMPLLAQLYRIPSFWARFLIFVALISVFGLMRWPLPKASLPAQMEYFLVGLALADIWISAWKERPLPLQRFDLPAAVAWLLMVASLYWNRSIPLAGMALPLVLLGTCLVSLRSRMMSRLLGHWFPVTFGGMCYTIYLYHLAIISAASRVSTRFIQTEWYPLNYALHALLLLPVVGMIGMILFVCAERPFMKWRPWDGR
jgi:peptidoglycan/LPS O-acetylase OafA/YrhL